MILILSVECIEIIQKQGKGMIVHAVIESSVSLKLVCKPEFDLYRQYINNIGFIN